MPTLVYGDVIAQVRMVVVEGAAHVSKPCGTGGGGGGAGGAHAASSSVKPTTMTTARFTA